MLDCFCVLVANPASVVVVLSIDIICTTFLKTSSVYLFLLYGTDVSFDVWCGARFREPIVWFVVVDIFDTFACFEQESMLRFTSPTYEVIVFDFQLDVFGSYLGICYRLFIVAQLELDSLTDDVTGFMFLDFRQIVCVCVCMCVCVCLCVYRKA